MHLDTEKILPHGHFIAKVPIDGLTTRQDQPDGRLVLVTAMTPTPDGIGKTTTTIGLADALRNLGKRAIFCVREPSLGPYFGIKGGGTGAGRAQVVPAEAINLHFVGDMYAVTEANNLLAAMVDNHLQHGNELGIDPRQIALRRVIDLNDRALRDIIIGLGGLKHGVPRRDGFNITPASEVMAILCLARDYGDLGERLARMVVAFTYRREPVRAAQIEAVGAMQVLLRDAIHPNLVQSLEGTPAFVHGGPFANIAQGTNTTIATRMGVEAVVAEHYARGGEGATDLAHAVLRVVEKNHRRKLRFLYPLDAPMERKIETLASKLYGADGVDFDSGARHDLELLNRHGFAKLPVCIAKTPMSLSDDASLRGRPRGFRLKVNELRISAGAGFVVVICGSIVTIPGLPKVPAAARIKVLPSGRATGLT